MDTTRSVHKGFVYQCEALTTIPELYSVGTKSHNDYGTVSVNLLSTGEIIVIKGIDQIYRLEANGAENDQYMLARLPIIVENELKWDIKDAKFYHQTWIYLDIIYLINFIDNNVENSALIVDVSQGRVFKIDLDQNIEIPRLNFSLSGTDQYRLYIFGGASFNKEVTNTLEVFDVGQYQYSKIETKNTAPSARQGHTSVIIGSYMFIFGGTSSVDLESDQVQ